MKTHITDQARHRQTLRDRHENIQHSSSKTQTDRKARQLKQSPDRNKDIQSVQSETSQILHETDTGRWLTGRQTERQTAGR